MKSKLLAVFISLIIVFSFVSCGKNEQDINNSSLTNSSEEDTVYSYIKEQYGFCDDIINGVYTSTMNGNSVDSQMIELNEECKSGALFYEIVNTENDEKKILCIYLDTNDDSYTVNLSVKLDYFTLDERGFLSEMKTSVYNVPKMKSKYYFSVTGKYLAVIGLSEHSEGFYENHYYLARDVDAEDSSLTSADYYYEEEVCIYDLNNNLDEVLKIKREITPPNPNETCICKLSDNNNIFAYASGFTSFTYEGANLLSTEQEFCDKANELLHDFSIDGLTFTRTSWTNRWYRLEVDESGIPDHMVKIDCSVAAGVPDGNGHVKSDVIFTKNSKKEEHGELQAEDPDIPVSYGTTDVITAAENVATIPDNIPVSIDPSQLQELQYFNLDGFWHSSDMHYVMSINVGSQFWNTFRYVNLYGSDKIKHGSIQQTSAYSLNLNAGEDAEKDFEVFAVNEELVSDEITFIKTSESVSNNILGNWYAGDKTYRFDNDGTYTVLMKNDSYWGYYFPVDESRIVLGVYSENFKDINHSFKCFDYTLDAEIFVINGFASLSR